MKKYILFVLLSVFSISLYSQETEKGFRIQAGLPFAKYGKFRHDLENGSETHYPSFLIQFDKDWRDGFRFGAYIGFAGQKNEAFFSEFSEVNYQYYRFGGVLSYSLNDALDALNISPEIGVALYASLRTGFSIESKKFDNALITKENRFLFDLGILVGGRYCISENIGVFSEIGYGNAGFITIGLAFDL